MGERAYIAIANEVVGGYDFIYLHNDGRLPWAGRHLLGSYNSVELALALITHGNASSINENIGKRIDLVRFFDADTKDPYYQKVRSNNQCKFYRRDRNDNDSGPTHIDSLGDLWNPENDSDIEYPYLFDASKGGWLYRDTSENKPFAKLTQAAIKKAK